MTNRQKKLLIAGGGHADIPLIRAAQALGYWVITSGNLPTDLGHTVSDQYCPGDYSDPEAMLEIARAMKVHAICACCNDFSAISAAYVARELGLPGHDDLETCRRLHHKDSYRALAKDIGIPTPEALSFADAGDACNALANLNFPLMVKPVDLSGGKGILKVDNCQQAEDTIVTAFEQSKSKRIVLEEFVAGSNHGMTTFLVGGKVVFHFSDNEHYYLNKYLVAAASCPGDTTPAAEQALIEQAEAVATALQLCDGILHIQYILTPTGDPVIIEICRRAPGDLYVSLVQLATGVDYPQWIIRAAIGDDLSDITQHPIQGAFMRHCIMADRNGSLESITFDPVLEGKIVDRMTWYEPGMIIEDHLVQKFGIVFIAFDSESEMAELAPKMQQLIYPHMTPL